VSRLPERLRAAAEREQRVLATFAEFAPRNDWTRLLARTKTRELLARKAVRS